MKFMRTNFTPPCKPPKSFKKGDIIKASKTFVQCGLCNLKPKEALPRGTKEGMKFKLISISIHGSRSWLVEELESHATFSLSKMFMRSIK